MLADLSDSVSRNGKLILAIWIVAVLVLVPPAAESLESMGYDLSDLGGAESSETDGILSAYFDEADMDQTRIPLIVVSYGSRDGYRQLQGDDESGIPCYTDYIRNRFMESPDWLKKLDAADGGLVVIREYGGISEGAVLMGLAYGPMYSDSDIASDTHALRESLAEFTDDFIYELYEDEAFFDVYVTGNDAVSEDMSSEIAMTLLASATIVIVLTLILTGLFFRSATTTLVVAASMVPPAVTTMAAAFGFSSMFGVFFVSGLLVLIGVLAMSFAHCIYMISVYRSELLSRGDRDAALKETVRRTGGPILSTSVCMLVCSMALSVVGDGVFASFGVCMSAGTVAVILSSLTVPASLMHVTRNELFWSVDPDRIGRPVLLKRFHEHAGERFRALMGSVSGITSNHGKAVLMASVCIIACCAGYLADAGDRNNAPYDMSDSLATGESGKGLDVLERYSDGGILHPLRITAGFGSPIAEITYDRDRGLQRLDWTSADAVSGMSALADAVYASDPDNISRTVTAMTWQSLKQLSDASADDPESVVSDVSGLLGSIDGTYRTAFDRTVAKLMAAGFGYADIVESCGPYIDYGLNEALGLIGYEMLPDRSIVVTHLLMNVYTCESPVSMRSLQTIEAVEHVIDGTDLATMHIGGAGVVYKEFMDSADSGFAKAVAFVLAALLAILALSMSIGPSVRSVVTTAAGAVVSLALTGLSMRMIWGSISATVQIAMLVVCVIIGIWFNSLQERRMEVCRKKGMDWRGASREMLVTLQPVVVITAAVLSASFMAFCISEIQMMEQLGFAVAVAILVDAFFIRTFVSPSIWSLGRRR